MTSPPPHASGVYQIRCIPTGKVYIGSAVNLRDRWYRHRKSLSRGTHRNRYLQNAWDKYGSQSFEFEILEYVDVSHLLLAEQKWIDSTSCTDRTIGFNLYNIAGSPGQSFAQTWEGFIDPDNNERTITNLHEFCRKNGLSFNAMHRLAKGQSKLKAHKGWTHRNSVRQRDYIKTYEGFIDPEGNAVGIITNLAEFCREHGLDNTHMLAVMNGRICSHRGWTHVRSRKPRNFKTYIGFVNPRGEQVIITNLAEFCRENALHPVKMRQLISGRVRCYKGWTWSNDNEQV
jgi:group I intron endonuclease